MAKPMTAGYDAMEGETAGHEATEGERRPDMRRQQERAIIRRCRKALKRGKVADKRWRPRGKEGVEFYYGIQWGEADKKKVKDQGRDPIVINRVRSTINLTYGMVVAQPLDWQVKPVGANDDGVATSATAGLKQVSAQNNTAYTMALAYRWALTYGVGAVYAGAYVRDADHRSEPVQHLLMDPREIRVDNNSKDLSYADAMWAIWSRKLDLEDVKRAYKDRASDLENLVMEEDPNLSKAQSGTALGPVNNTPPVSKWGEYSDWNYTDKHEETDKDNRQVVVHEMWERVPETAMLMYHKDGSVHEFDPSDPEQVQMLSQPGVLGYAEGTVYKVYQHIFAGELLLKTGESPYEHDQLPFVFVVYDRDLEGDPFSMVETLKDMQREVNYRRSKMLSELNNPQLLVDPSLLATMGLDVDSVQAHAAKPGAVWVGAPGSLQWLTRMDIASQQFSLMQDSKAEIQATSGANDDLMGYDSSSRSGKAKELVMGQGQMQMRPAEANYRSAFKRLGEITLQLIQQYHKDEWMVRLTDEAGTDQWLTLNEERVDPQTGMSAKVNDITSARLQVEVDVMPWTPTLRARSTEFLMSMAHNETDPYVRRSLERAAIIVSDMPEKAKILKIFDEQAQQQAQAAEQQGQAQQQMAMGEQQIKDRDSQMKALKTQAEVQKMQHDMEMDELDAQMKLSMPVMPTKQPSNAPFE